MKLAQNVGQVGKFGSLRLLGEPAEDGAITPFYVNHFPGLAQLAPDIVETILEGKHEPEMTLARVLQPLPAT